MYLYIKDNDVTPPNSSLVDSDNAGARNITMPNLVVGDVIPIRAVRVDGNGTVLSTTGLTCKLAIGIPGETAWIETELNATTTPDGFEAEIDLGDADIVAEIGTEPSLNATICVRVYSSTNPRTILLQSLKLLNPVQSPA